MADNDPTTPPAGTDFTPAGNLAVEAPTFTPDVDDAAAGPDVGSGGSEAGSKNGGGIDAPGLVQHLKDGAGKLGKEAGDKAKGFAEDGKTKASDALDEVARLLNDAAGQVDEKLGEQFGQYARSAADAVSGFSGNLRGREVDDLVDDVRGFVRKSPAVAIGTAAAIGFVLARLVKAGIDSATIGTEPANDGTGADAA